MPEPAKRRNNNKKKRDAHVETASARDTLKLLLFAQVILFCAAGAIPDPFKLLAFLPGAVVAGAGLFWVSAYVMALLQRLHASHTPSTVTPATAGPAKKRVLRITKIA